MSLSNARYALAMLSTALLLIAGCGGSGSGSGEAMGRISLGISDHPMHDATKVCIAFTEVELKPKEGPPILAEPVMADPSMNGVSNINLLEFQGVNAAPLLVDFALPAGEVEWIRLGVNAVRGGTGGMGDDPTSAECAGDYSYLATESGMTHNVYVPSGAQSGLKLIGKVIVPAGGQADFTAEVDLMKSLATPPGLEPDVIWRPTIQLMNNVEVGALTGRVADELIVDGCAPTVYLFEDDGMDADLDVLDALTSAMVDEQLDDMGLPEYHYTFGYVREGAYEIAFSCDDGVTLEPLMGKPAMVFPGELSEVDLP